MYNTILLPLVLSKNDHLYKIRIKSTIEMDEIDKTDIWSVVDQIKVNADRNLLFRETKLVNISFSKNLLAGNMT